MLDTTSTIGPVIHGGDVLYDEFGWFDLGKETFAGLDRVVVEEIVYEC